MSGSAHGGTERAILYAFLANGGIAIAKSVAAFVTGSGSMTAEAIHSFADTGNQVLLFLGLKQATKPPDAEHPLGYGMQSYFWSFIVALTLFSLGGLFSIYEGMHKLSSPEPLDQVWIAFSVLGIAILLESFSLAGCLREISVIRADRSFRDWLRHTRNSELIVVLGEDIGALVGLTLALAFVALAAVTGDPTWDAIGSMCIGVVLLVISFFLASRVRSLLVGRSADPLVREIIDRVIAETGCVDEIFNVITMQLGPDTMLAAKVRFRPDIDVGAAVARINLLERHLKQEVPGLRWSFIEPDVSD